MKQHIHEFEDKKDVIGKKPNFNEFNDMKDIKDMND